MPSGPVFECDRKRLLPIRQQPQHPQGRRLSPLVIGTNTKLEQPLKDPLRFSDFWRDSGRIIQCSKSIANYLVFTFSVAGMGINPKMVTHEMIDRVIGIMRGCPAISLRSLRVL